MRKVLQRPVHPVIFAIYPVAFLLQQNIDEMAVSESLRAAMACAVFGAALWGAARLVVSNSAKAATIASLALACIFLYADYSDSLWSIAVVAVSATAAAVAIARDHRNWSALTPFLNLTATLLVLGSIVQIVPFVTARDAPPPQSGNSAAERLPENLRDLVGRTPNIYYVILDGYGRDDVLKRFYQYDNTYFTQFLREHGFYVATNAHSNYARTTFSLASSLYFTHLIGFVEKNDLEDTRDMRPVVNLMKQNRVFHFVKQFGYTTHAYSSTMLNYQADHLELPETTLTYFENEVVARTPFKSLLHRVNQFNAFRIHHRAVLSTIESLHRAVRDESPKFVLAHIVCPHPPFVFDSSGAFREPLTRRIGLTDGDSAVGADMTPEQYRALYVDQIKWLNGEIMRWVDHVRTTDPAAVIILQGDHGPGSMFKWNSIAQTNMLERFSILNAVCLPGADPSVMYPEISPVNTFRVVFNAYFGMQYPLVPDRSFFSESRRPFRFYEVHFKSPDDAPDLPPAETPEML